MKTAKTVDTSATNPSGATIIPLVVAFVINLVLCVAEIIMATYALEHLGTTHQQVHLSQDSMSDMNTAMPYALDGTCTGKSNVTDISTDKMP